MATHSSILAWRIPWTEEPGGLQSKGSRRVGHNWTTLLLPLFMTVIKQSKKPLRTEGLISLGLCFHWHGRGAAEVFWTRLESVVCIRESDDTQLRAAGKGSGAHLIQTSSHGDAVADEIRIQNLKYRPILMIHILIAHKNKSLINTLFLGV